MPDPASAFAAQLAALVPVARVNCAAIEAVLDPASGFDHNDPEDRHFAPEAVALGMRQLALLLAPLTCYAVGLELQAAERERQQA